MLYPELEAKLLQARHALNDATSESIIQLCKKYLAHLAEYRSRLYELHGTPLIDQCLAPSVQEDVSSYRSSIRAAIESTTQERNSTEMLLLSFTTVSGYEAVEIFNQRKYKGHVDWELRAGGVKFSGGTSLDLMTIQEAVETASLLRREDHIAQHEAPALRELTLETSPGRLGSP